MIHKFKIWGERNSGTIYLQNLIAENFKYFFIHDIINNYYYYWKHGIPCNSIKKYFNQEKIIDIFIFRNLDDWLISMYNNQYHLKYIDDFENFLITKQMSSENTFLDFRTKKIINYDDNNKTIFEIRNYKIKSIIKYFENNSDVILVNLNYLQQSEENVITFLNAINKKFNLEIDENNYITKFKHTKNNSYEQNRKYELDINKFKKIIDLNSDKSIEEFINNLKFIIK